MGKSKSMRKFKNVTSDKFDDITNCFNSLHDVFLTESTDVYEQKFISVFNEWPKPEKFIDSLVNESIFYERHRRFNFFLVENYNCYTLRFKGRRKEQLSIKEFCSTESAKIYVQPSAYNVPGHCYFNLLIPEIQAIYFENFDFANCMLFLDNELINGVLSQCEKYDLFALD